jgi:hypothetical protein
MHALVSSSTLGSRDGVAWRRFAACRVVPHSCRPPLASERPRIANLGSTEVMTGAQLAAEEAVATSEQQAQQANAPHHRHAHALERPKPQLYEVLPARFTKGAAAENITLLCHARRPGQRPPGSVLRRARRRPAPRATQAAPARPPPLTPLPRSPAPHPPRRGLPQHCR